jgi:hypothetical protein
VRGREVVGWISAPDEDQGVRVDTLGGGSGRRKTLLDVLRVFGWGDGESKV